MVNQLLEYFMKNNCKRLIKKSLEKKKCLKGKVISCMLNGNGMIKMKISSLKISSLKMKQIN